MKLFQKTEVRMSKLQVALDSISANMGFVSAADAEVVLAHTNYKHSLPVVLRFHELREIVELSKAAEIIQAYEGAGAHFRDMAIPGGRIKGSWIRLGYKPPYIATPVLFSEDLPGVQK